MDLFCTIETFFVPQSDSIAHFMFQGSHTSQEGLKQVCVECLLFKDTEPNSIPYRTHSACAKSHILSYWARDSKNLGFQVASPRARWHAGALACALFRGPVPRTSPLTSELPCVQGNTPAGAMPGGKGPGLQKRSKSAANRASSSGETFKAAAMRTAQVAEASDQQASSATGSGTQGDARGRTGGTAARGAGGKRTRSSSEELSSDGSQAEGTDVESAGNDGAGARGQQVRVRGGVMAGQRTQ